MPRPKQYSWPAPDADGICASQTLGAAGAFTINGALRDLPATQQGVNRVVLAGIQRTVSITCAADISTVNFTIVGTDLRGAAVTETLAGPDTTPTTVETTAEYHTITSVTADASVGTATTIGTGTTGQTNWYTFDYYIAPVAISLQADISGTINYTVRTTDDDVQTDSAPAVTAVSGMSGATADAAASLTVPWRAVQGVVNSSTDGTLDLFVLQAG